MLDLLGYSRKELQRKVILDPEAGKADILDYLVNAMSVDKKNLYAIELDPELRFIIQGKGYKVIGDDFLSFNNTRHIDLIIMNPPFSEGAAHLLKAWEILYSGDVVCILNAETLNNPYTEDRKLLAQIIKDNNGVVEYRGKKFTTSERPTGVATVIVKLSKRQESKFEFNFGNTTKEKKFDLSADLFGDPIATRDVVGNMMIQFEKLRETYIEMMRIREKMHFYAQGLTSKVMAHASTSREQGDGNAGKFNIFCDLVRGDMWERVFSAVDGMEQLMTYQVQKNFQRFQADQGAMEFTRENVLSLLEMLHMNKGNILEEAVVQVFDLLTSFHADNKLHVEGWKTNDRYKVKMKMIVPRVVEIGYSGTYDVRCDGETYKRFEDIDKVMCYLTGTDFASLADGRIPGHYEKDENGNVIVDKFGKPCKWVSERVVYGDSLKGTVRRTKNGSTQKMESRFFYVRCYKKGTIHLEFKDKRLWQEFNMRACAGKNWLPEPERKAWEASRQKAQPKPEPKVLMIAA